MSVLIKGMKMPKSCNGCPTCRDGTTLDGDYWLMCGYNGKPLESEIAAGKPDWCPLVFIPPHGRLIDGDRLENIIFESLNNAIADCNSTPYGEALCMLIAKGIVDEIKGIPAIIPEEGDE